MLTVLRSAVVTGGGSGIGRAIALALVQEGARVLLVGRNSAKLQQAASDIGAEALVADVAAEGGRAAVATAAGGSLDVLVHSAGSYHAGDVAGLSAAAWAALDQVNVHAPILLTACCLSALRAARGSVVFINSSAGAMPAGAGRAAYAGGKHALRAAADALRAEVNPDIRVLSVFPGRTDTPMQTAVLAGEGRSASPGALLDPDDVAAMVLAALRLDARAEVTDIMLRPRHKL